MSFSINKFSDCSFACNARASNDCCNDLIFSACSAFVVCNVICVSTNIDLIPASVDDTLFKEATTLSHSAFFSFNASLKTVFVERNPLICISHSSIWNFMNTLVSWLCSILLRMAFNLETARRLFSVAMRSSPWKSFHSRTCFMMVGILSTSILLYEMKGWINAQKFSKLSLSFSLNFPEILFAHRSTALTALGSLSGLFSPTVSIGEHSISSVL